MGAKPYRIIKTFTPIVIQGPQGAQGFTASPGVIGPQGAQGSQGGPSRWCLRCRSTNWKGTGNDLDRYKIRIHEQESASAQIGGEPYNYHFVWLRQDFRGEPFRCEPTRIRFRFKCLDCGFEWDEMRCYFENY